MYPKKKEDLPEEHIEGLVGVTYYGGTRYERDDMLWYCSGIMVSLELRIILEKQWRNEGGVPPPVL